MATATHFQRRLLPNGRAYYESQGFQLEKPNRKQWAMVRGDVCPKHRSKSKHSFSVNLDSGAFFCHGCGAKGGDVVAFVMQRDSSDFKTAAKSLGLRSRQLDQVLFLTQQERGMK